MGFDQLRPSSLETIIATGKRSFTGTDPNKGCACRTNHLGAGRGSEVKLNRGTAKLPCSGRANLTGVAVLYAEGRRTTIRPHNAKQTGCNCMGLFQIARDYKQIRWTTLRVETISLHAHSPSRVSQSPGNAGSISISDYNGACMSGIQAGPWCDKILSSGESVTTLVRCAGMASLPINRLGCLTLGSKYDVQLHSSECEKRSSGGRNGNIELRLVRNPPPKQSRSNDINHRTSNQTLRVSQ
jgi:hypothetical protein